mmetsp:Transcript_15499/g.58912  ORF Transcript_15499/g.58912 Transcript_15499/m.58912 type:complete len:245 (-) Transcript_15499:79-813(-)
MLDGDGEDAVRPGRVLVELVSRLAAVVGALSCHGEDVLQAVALDLQQLRHEEALALALAHGQRLLGHREQVEDLIIEHLQVAAAKDAAVLLSEPLHEVANAPGQQSFLLRIEAGRCGATRRFHAAHRVRLPGARGAVREHGHGEAVQRRLQQLRQAAALEQLLLARPCAACEVEAEALERVLAPQQHVRRLGPAFGHGAPHGRPESNSDPDAVAVRQAHDTLILVRTQKRDMAQAPPRKLRLRR